MFRDAHKKYNDDINTSLPINLTAMYVKFIQNYQVQTTNPKVLKLKLRVFLIFNRFTGYCPENGKVFKSFYESINTNLYYFFLFFCKLRTSYGGCYGNDFLNHPPRFLIAKNFPHKAPCKNMMDIHFVSRQPATRDPQVLILNFSDLQIPWYYFLVLFMFSHIFTSQPIPINSFPFCQRCLLKLCVVVIVSTRTIPITYISQRQFNLLSNSWFTFCKSHCKYQNPRQSLHVLSRNVCY